MDITLITEGTYPHNLGGVSVWCDQLVREIGEHRFSLLALSATGDETVTWELPANVVDVRVVPLWAPGPPRRASRALQRHFAPVQERFFSSLVADDGHRGFTASLQELAGLAQMAKLGPALSTEAAVATLLDLAPPGQDRPGAAGRLSVADAVEVLSLLEHFLRPLAVPVPRADLCHTTANGLGTLPALAAKWSHGTPLLLTEHGVYLRELYLSYKPGTLAQPARALVLRFFKLLIETAYAEADVVAPVCRYNRTWELANGTPPGRVRPVHNGIDPALFPPAPAEPEVPTLVFVGRIDPLKDIETLLRAFALVLEQVPAARLRLFGPVPEGGQAYMDRCAALAHELGLDDGRARFEGKLSPTTAAYHAGHVVVLTSISEGLPYVILEAMATGRPVVATDVGGVSEAIGEAGVLVPPRDPAAIAAACTRLLLDGDERRARGAASRERVLRQFTTKRAFGLYRDLYNELVAPPAEVVDLHWRDVLVELASMTEQVGEAALSEPRASA